MFTADGLITKPSPYSVSETLDRLETLLLAKDVTIFARIDHASEAARVGLSMPPTQLLIFGNPKGGTPIMLTNPLSAIDLPLKALAWQSSTGAVSLSWTDPHFLQQRFVLPEDVIAPLESLSTLIEQAISP
jgi:uncharacterized protein (DUF302 family)